MNRNSLWTLSHLLVFATSPFRLFLAGGMLLAFCTPAFGQSFTEGQPIVGAASGSPVSSPMFLDASQFPGAPDICAMINGAYISITPPFTGNIDATAFTGTWPCLTNPFHGSNVSVHLYLNPQLTIVTSAPWFTPAFTHSIEGFLAGNVPETGGATIEACGQTSATWDVPSSTCKVTVPTFATTTVLPFPGWVHLTSITEAVSGTLRTATCAGACPPLVTGQVLSIKGSSQTMDNGYQTVVTPGASTFTFDNANRYPSDLAATTAVSLSMTFREPHGPFPADYYSCVLCMGAEGNGSATPLAEGNGWNHDGDAWTLRNIKVELGGNSNIFGVYTMNSQERSQLDQTRGGPSCGANCANVFFDRTEMPLGSLGTNAGVTRPIVRDFNMANESTVACTSCYGIVFEGENVLIQIPQGTCSQQPTAFVTSVIGTTVNVAIGNNGAGSCPSTQSCTISGAPVLYGTQLYGTSTTCTANAPLGFVSSVTIGGSTSGFGSSPFTGGPLLEDINVAPSTLFPFESGVWIEGVANAQVSKTHCLNLSKECVVVGSNGYTPGGVFFDIDGNGTTGGPLHLGYSIDNSQFVASLVSGAANLLTDDRNNVLITTAAQGNTLGQYNPSGLNMLVLPTVQALPNDQTNPPFLNELVTFTTGAATVTLAPIASANGIEGICIANCQASGGSTIPTNGQIAREGITACVFDSAPTIGHYVQTSPSTAGNCHDAGSTYPTSKQVLGRVLSSTAVGVNTYPIILYSSGIVPFSITGTSGGIPYFSSSSTLGSSGTLNTNVLVKGGGTGSAPLNSSVTDNGTSVTTTETLSAKRFISNGTSLSFSSFSLSGWGTVTSTSAAGTDQTFTISFTTGSSTMIGASIGLTFVDGSWPHSPNYICAQTAGGGTRGSMNTTTTTSAVTLTALFVPSASSTYTFTCNGMGY